MIKKIMILLFIVLTTLLLESCSLDKKKKMELPPSSVEIGKVIQKDSPIYVYAVGNTQANNTIDIRSQVTGVLKKAHVKEGQKVESGQLVYTIDPAPYEATLAQAEAQLREDQANLKLAEDKVARYKYLADQEYISELQFDELNTNVELAKAKIDIDKAQIEEARINLEYCYIHSPVAGKISYNLLDPGNLITANTTEMTTIREMDPMQVNFSISQKNFLKWQRLHDKEDSFFELILLDSDNNEIIKKGNLFFVDNNISENSGTILLKGLIENKDFSLWPGEFGKVRLVVKTVKDAILMPAQALQVGENSNYVFLVKEDHTVEVKDVTILEKYDDYLMIDQGVKAGDIVVTSGQLNLKPGMKIQIKEKVKNSEQKTTQ